MPRVKRSTIDTIRQQVSLVDVVGPYSNLKRAGSNYKGLSPFTQEKTPSFFVNPSKNVYTCFSSGNSGDIFHFVQQKENLTFYEAIEVLAKRYNIKIEYEDDGTPPEKASLRKELFEIHEIATEYYHQKLLEDTPEAQKMRSYWTEQRAFPLEVAVDYKIGLAPANDAGLIRTLIEKKCSPQAIKEAGLLYVRDYDRDLSNTRPRFRGRLMIPIRDVQGRVVAFTARQTELTPQDDASREAKYINSPETPIFVKSYILFNLERARLHLQDDNPLIFVEGQLDAIRCWHAGIKNAVAPQGTAVTDGQLSLARRYVAHIDCLLDGDNAGQKASMRILPIAFKAGLEVRFLQLPAGSDPDELLAKSGQQAIDDLRQQAMTSIQFAVHSLIGDRPLNPRQKSEAIKQIFQCIQQTDSAIVKDAYLNELAQITKIERYTLDADFAKQKPLSAPQPTTEKKGQENFSDKLTSSEYVLLFIALNDEELASKIAEQLNPEWIKTNHTEGRLLARIMEEHRERLWEGINYCEHLFEDENERNYFYRVINEDFFYEEPVKEANINLKKIFLDYFNRERSKIDNQLLNTPKTDAATIRELHRKRKDIRILIQNPPRLN